MTDPVTLSIPLDRLGALARQRPQDRSQQDRLYRTQGFHRLARLLENLVVRACDPNADGSERYAVIAGGRRLTALIDLAREGVLAHDVPVPCRVIGNGAADNELSLAENVVRVAMHPADQVQAFGALADHGATVAGIAARFGVAERTVEQRLRLGNAAPELLDAYRADEIDLDTLKAFAVTADRERQMAVWEQVKGQSYRPSGWQIKRMLTEDRVPATSITAHFVGVETYEAASGPGRPRPVRRRGRAGRLGSKIPISWTSSPPRGSRRRQTSSRPAGSGPRRVSRSTGATSPASARIDPQPAQPTGEEKAESERLRTRHNELAEMDDDAWTEQLVAEADAIETRLEEIEAAVEARATFRHEGFRNRRMHCHHRQGRQAASRPGPGPGPRTCRPKSPPMRMRQGTMMTAAMKPASPASRRPPSPLRPCRPRVPARKPRRARRRALASDSATTSAPSAPRWSRRISRRISGPPSTSRCSRWAARYSPPATTTMPSTSPSARRRTGHRSGPTTTPSPR